MKYLKTYNQLSEGLRDKMTAISIEDAYEKIKKHSVKDKFFYVISNDMYELFDIIIQEAFQDGKEYLINEELIRMSVIEGSFGVFKKILNDYPELIPDNEDDLVNYIIDDIMFLQQYDFLEELLKYDKVKNILSEEKHKTCLKYLEKRVN